MPKKSDNAGKPRKTPGAKTPGAKIPTATPKVVKPRTAAPRVENPHRSGFNPGTLDSSIIALPLLKQIQEEADRVKAALKPGDPTNLIVISHGWNNHMGEARELYGKFFESFRKRADAGVPGIQGRKFAVMAVLWPSKKFADQELIPSGAAGQGGAAGIGSFFSGIKAAALNVLNFTTYYQMKARAGAVGKAGVAPLIRDIKSLHAPLKIHLVGHSFGGCLMAATASALDKNATVPKAVPVESLSLLQAAFSHYGFSDKWDGSHPGAFRNVLASKQVKGPILATCTANDKAVGLAYPMASLLAGQVAAGVGDKNDKYGGIGRNGAQLTPESVSLKLLAAISRT